VSKSWFPDLIGPSSVSVNGGTAVRIRKKVLNILSSGVTAADNGSARRIDVTIPNPAWSQVDASTSSSGEWLPANSAFVAADMVRVSSSVNGTVMVGLDTASDPVAEPTRIVKYIANYGTHSITLSPPGFPLSGLRYFATTYSLTPNSTVRVTFDTVERVYRLRGAPVVTDYILLGTSPLTIGSNRLRNPL
jgi:hypothetical protein